MYFGKYSQIFPKKILTFPFSMKILTLRNCTFINFGCTLGIFLDSGPQTLSSGSDVYVNFEVSVKMWSESSLEYPITVSVQNLKISWSRYHKDMSNWPFP